MTATAYKPNPLRGQKAACGTPTESAPGFSISAGFLATTVITVRIESVTC
jgi:hypothetical protein